MYACHWQCGTAGTKGQRLHKHCISNFDRLIDPKGESVARIIQLGSAKQLTKSCPWVRLFYCLLVSEIELWLSVHNKRSDLERPLGRLQRSEALAPNNSASKIGRKLHKAVTRY